MKFNTKLKYFILGLLVMFLMPIDVFAKENINLKVDKTDLEMGDEVVVTAELTGKEKLYAFTATLSYDQEVFEPIYETDFSTNDSSISIAYNDSNKKFGIINKSGEIPTVLFTVRLRVKDDASVGNSFISLTNISSSNGEDLIEYDKVSTSVLVTRDAIDNETVPSNKKDETKDTKEESTTVFTTKPIVNILIIVSLVVGSYAVYLYLTNKDEKKRNILLVTTIALILLTVALCFINKNKSDVNDDGEVGYDDSEEIIKYLIDIEGTKKKDDFDMDVNNDGKIDVNDAGYSTSQSTQNINYKVTLKEIANGYYYKQNANIILTFEAKVTPKTEIKEIKIDGKYYPVLFDGKYYNVTLEGLSKAGVHQFKVTSVKLDNKRTIDTSLTVKKEILKQVPSVELLTYDEETKQLHFNLADKDKAFIDGEIIIYDNKGQELLRKNVESINNISQEFTKDVPYDIEVYVTYDLDNNKNDKNNHFENTLIFTHTLEVKSNYNFKISDVSITDAIEKGEKPKITFKSTNTYNYDIDYIVVDGKQMDVSKKMEGNYYEVTLDSVDTSKFGKYYAEIEQVVLTNLKAFKKDTDYKTNTLNYNVLKYAPKAEDIVLKEEKNTENISVQYDINDADKTLEDLQVILVDSTNKTVDKKDIEVENGVASTSKINLSYEGNTDGRYKVKFLANYNLGTEKYEYTESNIGEEEILTQKEIEIKNVTVTTIFPKKGQEKFKITYELEVSDSFKNGDKTKNYRTVSGVTINGLNYDANRTGNKDFVSNVSFTIPNESGVLELVATRIKLQSESYQGFSHIFYSVSPYTIKIDVLKDAPTIKNLEIVKENYEEQTVTFKFDVVDDKGGFKKGEIWLNEDHKEIKLGSNEITFEDVTTDKTFDLRFLADYDLDTKTLEGDGKTQTSFENTEIYKVSYGLFDNEKYENVVLEDANVLSNQHNKYFEKNEKLNISFDFNGLPEDLKLNLDKIIVDSKEYEVTATDDKYSVVLPGYNVAGEKKIEIKEVILNNGKKIKLKEPVILNIEILKDAITIDDFNYEVDDSKVKLSIKIKDLDNSLINSETDSIKVEVYDENDKSVATFNYAEILSFTKQADILRYYVKVYASYDRDKTINDNLNSYDRKELLNEVISLEKNYFEIKDITDISLYKQQGGNIVLVDNVSYSELKANYDKYFVKIAMDGAPTIYSKIKNVLDEDGKLVLVLDYQYVTKENDKEQKDLKITYGTINDGVAQNEVRPQSFDDLMESIKNNPSGHYTLKNDIDATEFKVSDNYYIDEFTGTIDGKGYKISNLSRPLFNKLGSGAEIKNLTIDDANIQVSARGILANNATGAKVSNVHIINSNIKADGSMNGNGIMFGDTRESISITNSSILNTSLSGGKRTGGFVGYAFNSLTLKNSYIKNVKITATSDAYGGLIGEIASAGTIDVSNCYSDVTMNGGYGNKAGIIGYTNNGNATKVSNVVSLSLGDSGKRFYGNGVNCTNCFELEESTMTSQSNLRTIKEISKEDIDYEFFTETLGWSTDTWNIPDDVSYDNLPILLTEDYDTSLSDEIGDDYNPDKELLYENLTMLMPFYKMSKISQSAKGINLNNPLAMYKIKHIVPVDSKGNVVTYLTSDNPQKIKKIKVVFENGQKQTYDVRYENTYDVIANYRINELKIDYTYNHYVIDSNSQLVNNLTNYLNTLSYDDNLDRLTPTYEDSRIYRDFYNDVTKKELKEFVLKVVSNSNYTNTSNNEIINDYLEKELKNDQKLERMLYVYNYFRRFYDLDVEGVKLYDFILFNSTGFDKSLTPMKISNIFLDNGNNFATNTTSDAFARTLGNYTNSNTITDFLALVVKSLSDKTPAEWVKGQFKGILEEIKVDDNPEIQYTLWDHLSTPDTGTGVKWYNFTLPILTLPKNAAYIISSPTQFVIGAQRTYIRNPDDPAQQNLLKQRMSTYITRMRAYYGNAYKILGDVSLFNNIHTVQIDKRFTYNPNGDMVSQNPYSTEEPFHKNFNEVIGQWAYADGNAATANGAYIIWRAEGVMDGNINPDLGNTQEYTYHTWSHETAHNIDARLFLRNNGRRFDAGGEDYADNNLMQYFSSGDIVMNFSVEFSKNADIASNLNPDRINSQEEVHDFYKKVFQTIYIMDYLEGKAFLELSPEDQAELAVQVFYRDEDKYNDEYSNYLKYKTTVYHEIPVEKFKEMKLDSVYDLYKNKLVMWPGVIYSTYGANRYGGENIYKVHWYQPHNDYGRPDSYSIKWFAYEMLGYAGYDKGYVEYFSNINSKKKRIYSNPDEELKKEEGSRNTTEVDYKTDLMALKKITNYDSFDDYKKARFEEVENNLEKINKVVDIDELYVEFYNALLEDAKTARNAREEAYKQYPNDDDTSVSRRNSIIAKGKEFAKSTAVRKKIYYALKNGTNDFEENVYFDSKQQDVGDLTIKKEEQDSILNEVENKDVVEVKDENEIVIDEDQYIEEGNKVLESTLPQDEEEYNKIPSDIEDLEQEELPQEEEQVEEKEEEEVPVTPETPGEVIIPDDSATVDSSNNSGKDGKGKDDKDQDDDNSSSGPDPDIPTDDEVTDNNSETTIETEAESSTDVIE